jgi:hypothetical protein
LYWKGCARRRASLALTAVEPRHDEEARRGGIVCPRVETALEARRKLAEVEKVLTGHLQLPRFFCELRKC